MKKVISLVLTVCLCLSLGCAAFASGEAGLVLLNGKENKSEVYGTDTFYAETLTQALLNSVKENCTIVYTNDAAGITSGLSASVHGEYTTAVNGVTVKLVPMDEVIILSAGDYKEDIAGNGKKVLVVLEDGANLTGTLTDVSLCIQADATWNLTGDSVLVGLDACRASLRYHVFGNGHIGWYNSEVYLSDDMREWTEQLADTLGGWTSYSDPSRVSFEDYAKAILAGNKDEVISSDNYFISIFPVNMAALITSSVYDETVDAADVTKQAGVYKWTDEYSSLRRGHGYAGGDIAYDTVITTDPVANGQANRSSVYATDTVIELSNIFVNEVSYSTSIVYADGTNRAQDAMMKYGVNSALWAQGKDAVISLKDFYCLAANDGAYATYGGSVLLENGVLDVTANHGLQICYNGTIIARNLDIVTTGMMGSAISSDHGGGFLLCDNVFAFAAYTSTGGSGIYCDGYCNFWIKDSTVGSLGDHAAVMCGGGTMNLIDSTLFSLYGTEEGEAMAEELEASGKVSASSGEFDPNAGSGESSGDVDVSSSGTSAKLGAGVYIHPMGNNPARSTTLSMTDMVLDVPGYGIWTYGKSADITVSGTLDVTDVGSGILLYATQMDSANRDFLGGMTLDKAYPLNSNVTTITFDGGKLVGTGDITWADEADHAEIHVALTNGSEYSGAVTATSMTIDASSVWTVTGKSVVAELDNQGAIVGTATQQADGTWVIVPGEAAAAADATLSDGDGAENESNSLGGEIYAADQASLDAYKAYLADFAMAGVGDPTFGDGTGGYDEAAAQNAVNELTSVGLNSNLAAFPIEMFVSAFGAMDYNAWSAAN